MELRAAGYQEPIYDVTLVGRVAALAVARAASQRSADRRDGLATSSQPLRDLVSSVIAEEMTRTVDERADDLEALRAEVEGSAERLECARRRRTRYGRV